MLEFLDQHLNRRAVMTVWARSGDPDAARAIAEAIRIVNNPTVSVLPAPQRHNDKPIRAA